MGKLKEKTFDIFKDYKKIILYIITFIVLYCTLMTGIITRKYDLKVGDIPKSDIKAHREIIDESATEARKKEAEEKVDKQYSLRTDVQKQSEEKIKGFFSSVEKVLAQDKPEEEKAKLIPRAPFKITDAQANKIASMNEQSTKKLESVCIDGLNKAYEAPIEDGNEQDLKEAKKEYTDFISSSDLSDSEKAIALNFVNVVEPNFFYDKEKTDELIKETLKQVPPVMIKKNQIVVSEGEPVTAHQLELLGTLGLLSDSASALYIYIALGVLVIIVMYLQYGYIHKYYPAINKEFSKIVMISILNVFPVILARLFGMMSNYIIPLACMPMLITLLLNYKISLVFSMLNVILIGGAVGFNPNIIILAILNVVLGGTLLRKMQQRNDILYSSITVAVLSSILTFSVGTLTTNNFMEILADSTFAAAGAILSGILTIGVLPFFESTFDIVTNAKLLELSNPNNPLLKKLLMEAPGTYHHSILVANLAELAAEQVGGNPLLARIGAYYHDVGKTKRPYFFRENQFGKKNPHDRLKPEVSSKIIISHVKDGSELAKEYNLPKTIHDFIVTHHGETLVKYFYLTVKNNSENSDEVKEEDFKYPGPKPMSKEQGIVMLADSTEAAVRSINEPTEEKIEKMVNNIIDDKLASGQLDNCDLTLRDISKIKKCFLKALNGIHHERIEYPDDNKKEKK
ncbi:HDIG domain-containing protein [Clostridium perfringens]|jgi:putative nucleotidyltransferase with HDIG domain|uniref:HD family phosphohydrolase n=2 Tax=Clostridium perfringens TaxID=1502 RepID=A0AAP6WP14_CLOPF|nr:HDIG domain-containing metalloprotein [Clostridium perfringens]ALG49622.1 Membrane protein containing HD superfamily hydrolase domain [Clostridium perfringens]ASY52286.1 phosphohydrolase [Clostridium perfringens]AWS26817.1 HD family phosphohydrolase [Clostridium perfringens]EDT25166.1 putative hydrolase [Clostridium perfringens B str. ATCC 3626]EDT27798.1 putative hydrolase [Clostridium perfringens CPE str. F4969]